MDSIFFKEEGEGHPLVLIHGFCENHKMWDSISRELSNEFRVLSPDLPGFGKSPLDQRNISLEEVAVALESWMDENSTKNPVIIGHSLGGYVALALLELMGSEIQGIGLFNSTSYADSIEKKSMRDRAYTFIEKNGVQKFVDSFVPQLFPEPKRKELSNDILLAIEQAHSSSLEGLLAYTLAMKNRPDRSELLSHFSGNKLLIAGELDTAVSLDDSRRQSSLFTHYSEIENMGHMGMIEEKEKTLDLIRAFAKETFPKNLRQA